MKEMMHDPVFWVGVAFVAFVAMVAKPLWKIIASALDSRGAKIQQELDEAVRLREEAQAILVSYQQKQKEVLEEAQRILQQTQADAKAMAVQAEAELKVSLEKRKAMAMSRIAQSETKAIQAVQQHVVDIAINAAKLIVVEQLKSGQSEELIKLAASDIEKKLH